MVGTVLEDRYELQELVGRGGMSSVYRARDRILGREVAIKVLHPQYASDSEYVERFRREAQAVAKLAHPNVAVVIDRGEDDGRPYIVFEYVEGGNLKTLIEREAPLPLERVVELGIQIARGLEHAHRGSLVHRDVKPQNVLLDRARQAKLIDFGIARSSAEVRPGLTLTGTVLGSSDYIAPEQAQGRSVEERTDVYSLAIVLYEMLTGELPFPGENFVAVAMRHINETPRSVVERRPDVPPRLAALMQRSLAKDPEKRPMMAAVVQELERCLQELPAEVDTLSNVPAVRFRPPGALSAWQLRAILAGLVIAAAVGVYLVAFRSSGSPPAAAFEARAPAGHDGVRPVRDERRAQRAGAARDRRQREHGVADRELPGRTESRQAGRRPRPRCRPCRVATPNHGGHEHSRLRRTNPGGSGTELLPRHCLDDQDNRCAHRLRPDRRPASLLPALDPAPRPEIRQRPHHPGQRLSVAQPPAAVEALEGQVGQLFEQVVVGHA